VVAVGPGFPEGPVTITSPAGSHVRVSMAGEAAAMPGMVDLCAALYRSLAMPLHEAAVEGLLASQ
jgi:phosphoribosylcarboxyaminoimidazole (NCAIR) mutase